MSRFRIIAALLCIGSILHPGDSHAQVSGWVLTEGTADPVPDALVTVQATDIRTTTGADGSFSLPGASGSGLVIVGAGKGFYNASATVDAPDSGVEIRLPAVPQDDNPAYSFVEPQTCGGCHPDQFQQWTDSPMALAGPNTWVYDIYDGTGTAGGMGGFVYKRDSRFAEHNPNSECASCHQPEPWIDVPFGPLDDIDDLSVGALHGISCEVCHKFADIDETKPNFPGIFPGSATITRPESGSSQVLYGLLGDSNYHLPGVMRSSYQPQLGAAVCAACHQDKNDPDEDHDFEEENGIISEPTYLEWLDSPYGDPDSGFYQDCVGCHMPSYGATQVCNVLNPPLIRDPETIRHHRIEGTTPVFLENAVELRLIANRVGDVIEAEVQIENNGTGHHVPTGVTIRNMILLVEAWRGEDELPLNHLGDQVVHELGGIGDPAQGYFAGLPGKYFSKVNHDIDGNGPTFFTDATGIQFDNRIPALATDTTQYAFAVPEGAGTYHVRARLIYRRSFRFLTDAKGWTVDGHGNPLEDVAPPYFGHLMEEEEWVLDPSGVEESTIGVARASLSPPYPNPANLGAELNFRLEAPEFVELQLFDASGRMLRTLYDGVATPGEHRLHWDGSLEAGTPLPSGSYVVRLSTRDGSLSRKLVVLR